MQVGHEIEVSLVGIRDCDGLGAWWTSLQSRSDHSFFTSWGWIECWLKHLPRELSPRVLVAQSASQVVGLAILHRHQVRRAKLVKSRVLQLNETGDEELDMLTVEHNSILADRRMAPAVHRACLNFMLDSRQEWDEFYAAGVDVGSDFEQVLSNPPSGVLKKIEREVPCYAVDLEALRRSQKPHLASLSSNTQRQVRRSIRLYESLGPLTIHAAASCAEAITYFDELKRLHQKKWHARSQPGAFGNEFTDAFHRSLIRSAFPRNEIQLLRIQAGNSTIGFLYNFVYAGRVLAYQTGFDYDHHHAKKPGLISHLLAIEYNASHGEAIYDFLGGEGQHKRSLGQRGTPMRWMVWQRDALKFQLEDWLRSQRRRLFAPFVFPKWYLSCFATRSTAAKTS